MSKNERNSINTLKCSGEINLKNADKGTTTVILDKHKSRIDEGIQQLSNKFYKPLSSPIVQDTAGKVKEMVYQSHIPEFYVR